MEEQRWRRRLKGLALSAGYCAAFLLLWRVSFNQWYLPAGLRLACLLLLPIRYWPYAFAGDAAALLVTRVPKADQYSIQWAYLSPFLLISFISIVPWIFRVYFKGREIIAKKLPAIGFVAAIWSSVVGMGLNYFLDGPRKLVSLENFVSYSVGNYLGIMMTLLPCLLWQQRHQWQGKLIEIFQSVGIAALMISALYGAVFITGAQGAPIQLMPLVFMLLPAVYLTVLYGWHGAAVGAMMVNLAIALALPRSNVAGEFDGVILMAQILLSVASAGLLTVGSHISSLFDKSSAALLAEFKALQVLRQRDADGDQTKGALRTLLRSTEQRFRENALLLAAARGDLDSYRHDVVRQLKEQQHYERAMEVLTSGMEAGKTLERQRGQLYPFEIETHGLFAALMGPTFLDVWQQHARVKQDLWGHQRYLSLPLRLAAFRATMRAFESMVDCAPSEYQLRIRAWRRGDRSGVTVFIRCLPTREPDALSAHAQTALHELDARVLAYEGALKRRSSQHLAFLMSEINQPDEMGCAAA
jgi:hypothetical protein